MKSDRENMYPFVAIDGSDYATEEEMKDANERIRAAASLEEKIQKRIERGNKLIYPERQEQWAEKVRHEATLTSPTTGSIDISLEIMELLESGAPLEEIDRRYRQLIGWNTSLKWDTLDQILVFSKRGIEFYKLEAPSFGVKIDEVEVSEFIEQLRKENQSYAAAGYASEMLETKQDLLNNVGNYIERGMRLVYPQKADAWKSYVKDYVKNYAAASILYGSAPIKYALEIMEMLENGCSIEEVIDHFERLDTDRGIDETIRDMVLRFSKRGPEFYRLTTRPQPDESEWRLYQQIMTENAKYDSDGEYASGGKTN